MQDAELHLLGIVPLTILKLLLSEKLGDIWIPPSLFILSQLPQVNDGLDKLDRAEGDQEVEEEWESACMLVFDLVTLPVASRII